MSKFIDRHEISAILEVSYDVVCFNAPRSWNIERFRVNVSPRNVRYWREPTLRQLNALGLLSANSSNSAKSA
jgi:hypothetical protein